MASAAPEARVPVTYAFQEGAAGPLAPPHVGTAEDYGAEEIEVIEAIEEIDDFKE